MRAELGLLLVLAVASRSDGFSEGEHQRRESVRLGQLPPCRARQVVKCLGLGSLGSGGAKDYGRLIVMGDFATNAWEVARRTVSCSRGSSNFWIRGSGHVLQ